MFLLTKAPRYWFDAEAVREPLIVAPHAPGNKKLDASRNDHDSMDKVWGNPAGRNVRSVWQIATQPYPEAHFATFPEELARRCILAGCPVRVCRVCGRPSERIVETNVTGERHVSPKDEASHRARGGTSIESSRLHSQYFDYRRQDIGWSDCGHNDWRPGLVLDPFIGSGTVAKVARDHQRHAIGIDLNQTYLELAARRLQQLSLLTQ